MNNGIQEVITKYENSHDCQLKFRLLIVKLYLQNYSGTEIADILQISKSSVYYWINQYKEKGIVGLKGNKRNGRPRKLDYDQLGEDLQQSPIDFGINSNQWSVATIKQHILQSQDMNISSSHIYAVLSKLGLSLNCNGINCSKTKEVRTIRGDVITPLHLEVLSEASIMLDAPITRIITSRGIRPELKVISQSKDKVILKGETETGVLTLTFEEFHDKAS